MRWLAALFLLVTAAPALAFECGRVEFEGEDFTACRADPAMIELRLFLNDPESGKPLGSFTNLEALVEAEGRKLLFAMNAGMYHRDRSPVGHYVENGAEARPVITSDGPGNFGLLPNGVFCIGDGWARVYETTRFVAAKPACRHATQSGPMLVIDGKLHPRFKKTSDSLFVRNGVGTSENGRTVWFAISEEPVNFHLFARLFRDKLGNPQALYFDGNISRVYVPELGRHDGGFPMGPMVGAIALPGKGG
ncbi:MAG: phosphodiester glycosidase family protein [Roseovarius sp.]